MPFCDLTTRKFFFFSGVPGSFLPQSTEAYMYDCEELKKKQAIIKFFIYKIFHFLIFFIKVYYYFVKIN